MSVGLFTRKGDSYQTANEVTQKNQLGSLQMFLVLWNEHCQTPQYLSEEMDLKRTHRAETNSKGWKHIPVRKFILLEALGLSCYRVNELD